MLPDAVSCHTHMLLLPSAHDRECISVIQTWLWMWNSSCMESYRHPHCNTLAEDVQESSCRLQSTRIRSGTTAEGQRQHSSSRLTATNAWIYSNKLRPETSERVRWRADRSERTNLRTVWMLIRSLSVNGPALYPSLELRPLLVWLQMTFYFLHWLSHHVLI